MVSFFIWNMIWRKRYNSVEKYRNVSSELFDAAERYEIQNKKNASSHNLYLNYNIFFHESLQLKWLLILTPDAAVVEVAWSQMLIAGILKVIYSYWPISASQKHQLMPITSHLLWGLKFICYWGKNRPRNVDLTISRMNDVDSHAKLVCKSFSDTRFPFFISKMFTSMTLLKAPSLSSFPPSLSSALAIHAVLWGGNIKEDSFVCTAWLYLLIFRRENSTLIRTDNFLLASKNC